MNKLKAFTTILFLTLCTLTAAAQKCITGDCKTGIGTMVYNNGDTYTGKFLNGQRNGKGKQLYSNGNLYEGYWISGLRSIMGKYIFNDGTQRVFTGKFLNDIGEGKLKINNGLAKRGRLSANNVFVPAPLVSQQVINNLKKSVVVIKLRGGFGSGFVLGDKYIATNFHVVEPIINFHNSGIKQGSIAAGTPMRVDLKMFDKLLVNVPVSMVYRHPGEVDLAIIRIDSNIVFPYPALELNGNNNPSEHAEVFAIGGDDFSVKQGKVQSVYFGEVVAQSGFKAKGQFIVSTAKVIPGDSGSPLFNEKGKVVSIMCWGTSDNADISLSMTLNGAIGTELINVIPGLVISREESPANAGIITPATIPAPVIINERIISSAAAAIVNFPGTTNIGCLVRRNFILTSGSFPAIANGQEDSLLITLKGIDKIFTVKKIVIDSLLNICLLKIETQNNYAFAEIAETDVTGNVIDAFVVTKGNKTVVKQGKATMGLMYEDILIGMLGFSSQLQSPVFNSNGALIGIVVQLDGGLSYFIDLSTKRQEILDAFTQN